VVVKNTILSVLTIANNILICKIELNHKRKLPWKPILIDSINMLCTIRSLSWDKHSLTAPFSFNVFILKNFVQIIHIDFHSMLQKAKMWQIHLRKTIVVLHILIVLPNPLYSHIIIEYVVKMKQTTSSIDSLWWRSICGLTSLWW